MKLGLFAFLTLLGVTVLLASPYLPGRIFFRAYEELELGMTQNDVRQLFGEKQDFSCRLGSSEIWYYSRPGFLTGTFDEMKFARGTIVQSADELPYAYANVQLAFDAEGLLHAFTWNGETRSVASTSGMVGGDHLKYLVNTDF